MAKEPEDLVLRLLREIRETLAEHSKLLMAHSEEFKAINKRLDSLISLVTHSLGQSTSTQFRQAEQQSQIDELFEKLEKLLSEPHS
jgi:hypothetical protein